MKHITFTIIALALMALPQMSFAANGRYVKNLKAGAVNDTVEVKQLQKYFVKRNWMKTTNVTGTFGSITKANVLKFQKERGIPETGEVDRITRAWLDECEF